MARHANQFGSLRRIIGRFRGAPHVGSEVDEFAPLSFLPERFGDSLALYPVILN